MKTKNNNLFKKREKCRCSENSPKKKELGHGCTVFAFSAAAGAASFS